MLTVLPGSLTSYVLLLTTDVSCLLSFVLRLTSYDLRVTSDVSRLTSQIWHLTSSIFLRVSSHKSQWQTASGADIAATVSQHSQRNSCFSLTWCQENIIQKSEKTAANFWDMPLCLLSSVLRLPSYILRLASYVLRLTSYVLRPTSYVLCLTFVLRFYLSIFPDRPTFRPSVRLFVRPTVRWVISRTVCMLQYY